MKEAEFKESLDWVFDVAHEDALSHIKIEKDKTFHLQQRMKGRLASWAPWTRNWPIKRQGRRSGRCEKPDDKQHIRWR